MLTRYVLHLDAEDTPTRAAQRAIESVKAEIARRLSSVMAQQARESRARQSARLAGEAWQLETLLAQLDQTEVE